MLTITVKSPRFTLGEIVITTNALSILTPHEYNEGLQRHANCDWGTLSAEDIECNDAALQDGGRLFSAYGKGPKRFWIITESEGSVTTILMPEDY